MPVALGRFDPKPLSPREAEVVALVGQGYSNKLIAQALDIEPETVKTHLDRARSKLGAIDRRDAAKKAKQLVPHNGGPPSTGTDPHVDLTANKVAVVAETKASVATDAEKRSRFRLQKWAQLDAVGLVGRLLWVGGITVLIGLLGIGLLVVADGFTVAIHNLEITGHPR